MNTQFGSNWFSEAWDCGHQKDVKLAGFAGEEKEYALGLFGGVDQLIGVANVLSGFLLCKY
jgi:hypothetical protein